MARQEPHPFSREIGKNPDTFASSRKLRELWAREETDGFLSVVHERDPTLIMVSDLSEEDQDAFTEEYERRLGES